MAQYAPTFDPARIALHLTHPGGPVETTRLTMAQALVRWLTAQKTEIDGQVVPLFPGAFGIFGHGNVTSLAEALAEVKDVFPTWRGHNEQSMALSAVGYAKAMRRKQIMVATSSVGPGSTNMVTAAGVAITNRLPLLLLSGDTFTHRIVDPVLQQVEQFGDPTITAADTFKPVTRFWDRIVKPEQLLKSLPQALAVMLDPAECGPAFIALPQDVQAEAYDYPTKFFDEKVHYIRRPQADPREIESAAAAIASAKQPLVISGGGVLYSGAAETIGAIASKRNIPVVETFAGKGAFADDEPFYAGSLGIAGDACSNAIAEDADVVIAVGTKLQDFTTGSWALFKDPKVKIVAINAARWDATKQQAVGVIGDADASLQQIDAALGDYAAPSAWIERARSEKAKWNEHLDEFGRAVSDPPAYNQVIQRVHQISDPTDYVLSAAGGLPGELFAGWRTKEPNTFDCEFGFSCMGYEIAGAVGAKMALPDRDVVSWVGDGSYLMMNSDIYASVLTGNKVIFIVCDNEGFAVINRLQVNQGGEEFNNLLRTTKHTNLHKVDFVAHAMSMGANAEKVESLDDIPAAYERAKASDKTYVLVVDVAQYEWVGGGTWWEVGVPEVSNRAEVRAARAVYEAESKHQRPGV
jgi:3D-(3,5/4)-trihydroxycyclohexane-1,2-dione acylhydrolase (decyclizing)